MDRKTLKLLLLHEEFKDIVQAYIDDSPNLDGELVDVFYGAEYRGTVKTITYLELKNSEKFGGNVKIELDASNQMVMDAIVMWLEKSRLPFIANKFERVTVQERQSDNGNSSLFWVVEVRTK